jgi:DNA helicase IV
VGQKREEIAREQEYFDRAWARLERKKQNMGELAKAAAHHAAAIALNKHGQLQQRLTDGDAAAFGRIDLDDERRYIGKHLIIGEDGEPLVIGWQAPAARPFYQASHAEPMGVDLKRSFDCTGNRIQDFTDVFFSGAEVTGPDETLLRELSRQRTGRMRDIVRTIQRAQDELIRQPLERLLVIEGAPGTGKTVIALHRVSWLLYNHGNALKDRDVLVVGPHPTFTRYIESVLPGLGDEQVTQLDIARLAPAVHRGRREPDEVSRLKGDVRMAGLLARALEARIGTAGAVERLSIAGRFITIPGTVVDEAVAASRSQDGPFAVRRLALRDRLLRLVGERGAVAHPSDVDGLLNRLWPQLSAAALVRDLFASPERLARASAGEFTPEELRLLRRRGADRLSEEVWSRDDLPLLDEAHWLIEGPGRRYAHIVVDEAQDLSPMQLRGIARRSSTGSLTVIGDLAQSTGAWARDSWDELLAHLPRKQRTAVHRLEFAYRVPREVFDFVKPLLSVAAPGTPALEVVRSGPSQPFVHRVRAERRAGTVATLAAVHAGQGRFVGVVCPASRRAEVEEALAANDINWSSADRGDLGLSVNLVSPREAKGLEFDAVIVVEPEEIVASDPRGHRLLYVAMTRTIGFLDVVCEGEPLPLTTTYTRPSHVDKTDSKQHNALAHQIVAMLRPHPDWPQVLDEVNRLLSGTPHP